MHPRHLSIEDFSYHLPEDRIAHFPSAVRDASKLLVYKDGHITDDHYRNISGFIPEGSLMIFNQTRVVHARLLFPRQTGSKIEVFCLEPGPQYPDIQMALAQRGRVLWQCLVGGAKKWKAGETLALAHDGPESFRLTANIIERQPGYFLIELKWDDEQLSFAEVLQYAGKVPLPPYLNREPGATDEGRYQTIFANAPGSVAAPTAGLHFTDEVLQSLALHHIDTEMVTLHVGAGTFMPVKSKQMAGHEMHAEWIEVKKATIEHLLAHLGAKIIAVGTTSLRTLESLYYIGNKLVNQQPVHWEGIAVTQWEPYETTEEHSLERVLRALLAFFESTGTTSFTTRTRILIAPGYRFHLVDGLVTNFHQPKSTLLLLVAALIGNNWQQVYQHALQNGYRFLSYGDGSLLWRQTGR